VRRWGWGRRVVVAAAAAAGGGAHGRLRLASPWIRETRAGQGARDVGGGRRGRGRLLRRVAGAGVDGEADGARRRGGVGRRGSGGREDSELTFPRLFFSRCSPSKVALAPAFGRWWRWHSRSLGVFGASTATATRRRGALLGTVGRMCCGRAVSTHIWTAS
jgi:hypothetical protein